MNKKTKLKDLIVNDKNVDKPVFSEEFKKIIFNITSSIHSIDDRVGKLEMLDVDTSVDNLKPIDVVDTSVDNLKPMDVVGASVDKLKPAKNDDIKKPKEISKALHTKISSKQKTNIRRGDSVADILARIFQSMNESRLEMIKSSELKRNFEDEHIKERKITRKRMTYKKHKLKKDKFNIAGLLTMGLIVNFGDIVKWATSLSEPFTEFIDKIKVEFQSFDLTKKTEELAGVISSFISDMKTSLLQGIDKFLNTWVEELLSWIEKTSGFIKFNRENIPRSNLSGSGYRTPEGDKKTADMVKDKEAGMPAKEFNEKYNTSTTEPTITEPITTKTSGKMTSATVTQETEDMMEERRPTSDRIENAVNNVGSFLYKVGAGVADVVGHTAGTIFDRTVDDVGSMFTQTGKDLNARSRQTYKNITDIEKTPEEKKLYKQQQSEYRQTHKAGMFGPVEIPKDEQRIKPTNPIVDKINAPDVTPPTSSSVEYNKNQTKNNDLNAKPKPTISTSTTPAKNVNMGGSQSNVSPGNPAVCRNVDKTLSHISSGNTCKV